MAFLALVSARALVSDVRPGRIVAQIVRVGLVGKVRTGRKAAQIVRVVLVGNVETGGIVAQIVRVDLVGVVEVLTSSAPAPNAARLGTSANATIA